MHRTLSRTARTILQLVASGALTAAVTAIANGLSPTVTVAVGAMWMVVVTAAQNALEGSGTIPAILEPPHATANERYISARLADQRRK